MRAFGFSYPDNFNGELQAVALGGQAADFDGFSGCSGHARI